MPQQSGQSPDGEGRQPAKAVKNGSKFALKNWRVRSRLLALIAIPTIAAAVLGGLRINSSLDSAAAYERVHTAAELTASLSRLVDELQLERDLSARYVALGRPRGSLPNVAKQDGIVDKVAQEVGARIGEAIDGGAAEAFGDRGQAELLQIRARINEIKSVRKTALETQLPALPTIAAYSRTIADLLSLHDEIVQGVADPNLNGGAAAFAALGRAKEQASRERANLAVALATKEFSTEGLNAMLAARAQRDSELATFRAEATVNERQLYDDTVSSQKVDRAGALRARAIVLALQGAVLTRVDVSGNSRGDQTWFDASSDIVDRMRAVEEKVAVAVIDRSRLLQEEEQRSALIAAAVTVAILILVLVMTVIMAQSLVRPLRRLRTEALAIAGQRLPETVQSMRESGEATEVEVAPIGVASDDEIGEVARAFDEVHREAIRLAGQEARLRSNVNSMFVNLSRRSQTLVERQLSLIESLEHGEQDEERLGNLFRLDHLATRMRRNSENLLVLAGQEPARRWSQPVPLIDVVRASLSEVENYERVQLQLSAGVSVVGTSVNDVVHLIAELVENAIAFSPRETRVVVSSNRIDGGGVMVSVTDLGIGMTAEELAQANWRLANPPVVDVSVSRRMGLFVVGRLALRHGIRVQLRQQDSGGLTAMVLLPENLLAVSGARPGAPAASPSSDWPGSMMSMDRPPVLASPTGLDSRTPSFASFEAAHRNSFASIDLAAQQFNSFDAGQSSFGGGQFGQAPADTPWPGQVPPPGTGPGNPQDTAGGWAAASQPDPTPWQGSVPPGATGAWPTGPSAPTRDNPAAWPGSQAGAQDSWSASPPAAPEAWSGASAGPDTWSASPPAAPEAWSGSPAAPAAWPGSQAGAQDSWSASPPAAPAAPGAWPGSQAGPDSWSGSSNRGGDSGGWPSGGDSVSFEGGHAFEAADNTGPLPAILDASPMEEAREEFLPIFAAVESDWFKKADPVTPVQEQPEEIQETAQLQQPASANSWSSPADTGWQAAKAAAEPSLGGITGSGLPKRVPKANLVPGTAASDSANAPQTPALRPTVSPEAVRNRLASFQQGVRQGRAAAKGESGDGRPYPDFRRDVEGNKEDR
ncbi:signal transduction histidine kinase [Streptosporangium becharense]|uniref:histidine kinase n=1 Tax=Streptosporangium becharense TaxID=1816182 RepID=A0A7W9MG20_9ACTN|nr:nitrate- and nitrite sensing domain-containing protein [Streptosporangium becharense]MBB2910046.1 signal transduction histidine kinase [Streptosporangium becharense]MBB5818999.1 signal transduction histidine kinase [Streptosporangium becharense]